MDWKMILLFFLAALIGFFIGDFEGVIRGYLAALKHLPKDRIEIKPVLRLHRPKSLWPPVRISTYRPGGEGPVIWEWPKPWVYEPPPEANGKLPLLLDIANRAASGKAGRPRDDVWPTSAAKYFKAVDEFYKFMGEAASARERKDGSFTRACKYNKGGEIPEGTVRSWLDSGWGDKNPTAKNSP